MVWRDKWKKRIMQINEHVFYAWIHANSREEKNFFNVFWNVSSFWLAQVGILNEFNGLIFCKAQVSCWWIIVYCVLLVTMNPMTISYFIYYPNFCSFSLISTLLFAFSLPNNFPFSTSYFFFYSFPNLMQAMLSKNRNYSTTFI